jgi:hypothetical protein
MEKSPGFGYFKDIGALVFGGQKIYRDDSQPRNGRPKPDRYPFGPVFRPQGNPVSPGKPCRQEPPAYTAAFAGKSRERPAGKFFFTFGTVKNSGFLPPFGGYSVKPCGKIGIGDIGPIGNILTKFQHDYMINRSYNFVENNIRKMSENNRNVRLDRTFLLN